MTFMKRSGIRSRISAVDTNIYSMAKQTAKRILPAYIAGFLAYAAIYIVRLNFSVASAAFETSGVLTKAQIGVIGSIFSLTYAIAKVPGGYIGDACPSRAVILAGLLIAASTNFIIGLFPSFAVIAVLWGVNAFGQAMLWGPLLRSYRESCGGKAYLTISRTLGTSIPVGSIIGLCLSSWLVGRRDVSACFIVPALLVLLIAALARIFLFSAPGHSNAKNGGFIGAFRAMLTQKRFREIVFPAMAHGMIKDNITVWLALYFVDKYGVDVSKVAGYVFFIPLLTMLGKSSYLFLAKLLKDDYRISILSFAVCAVCALVLCVFDVPLFGAVLCFGLISALVAIINTHFLVAFPAEIATENTFSFAASIMDLLTYGGAGFGSLIFGVLITKFGFGSMFLVWSVFSAASIAVLWHMKKTAAAAAYN